MPGCEWNVVASSQVIDYVHRHGGQLYVWATHYRCCKGRLTLLETSTERSRNREFGSHSMDAFQLFLDASIGRPPTTLRLELALFPRRHVRALWDGCAWVP